MDAEVYIATEWKKKHDAEKARADAAEAKLREMQEAVREYLTACSPVKFDYSEIGNGDDVATDISDAERKLRALLPKEQKTP